MLGLSESLAYGANVLFLLNMPDSRPKLQWDGCVQTPLADKSATNSE